MSFKKGPQTPSDIYVTYGMAQGMWDGPGQTNLSWAKTDLARAKADMSREPHTKVYLLALMSMRKS
jgi:hypothetical protein